MNLFEEVYGKFQFDKTKTIKVVECFAGIGTQAMALKRLARDYNLKFEFVAISEIDKYAIQSYNAIHGKTHNLGAIGEFERFPKDIDICSWSFPCQDISIAGRQKGLVEDTRSNYGFVFLDTIKNTPKDERPKILLMENVPALVSEKFQKDYQEIHRRLEEMGYTSWGGLMNAKDYGVAQNRERIFIVSILGENSYSFPQPFPLVKRLKDYLEENVDEKYYLSKKMVNYIFSEDSKYKVNKNSLRLDRDIACAKTTREGSTRADTSDYITQTCLLKNQEMNAVIKIPEATKKGYAEAEDGDGVYLNRPHQKRGVVQKGMIQTIKTRVNESNNVYLANKELHIRKLTPKETWRLMGIDDEDFDKAQASGVSDTQLYKQAGNAIVVDVLYYIFKNLFDLEGVKND